MNSISLHGVWTRSIAGGPAFDQVVPYSALPCGESDVWTYFDRPDAQGRVLLRFEGITYRATVRLNGQVIGQMLPYSRYVFDITTLLKQKDNHLCVTIEDMHVAFGPSEGWENYGGIIRGVYLDLAPQAYVDDIYFRADFSENYMSAQARVSMTFAHAEGQPVRVCLRDAAGVAVSEAAGTVQDGACDLVFPVSRPQLWSPEMPILYHLEVSLPEHSKIIRVGFKELKIDKTRFLLNGRELFLRGVCRHDLWGDQGHTLTDEQIRRDMTMIKATGANFVRLVHYPHDERVLHIADELGLLVSDEPGLWWSDMHNPELVDGALQVMEKAVLRDRSHVSVAFWLAFNECIFTEEYLQASSALCKRLDPSRPVSGANCMNLEMTKELFSRCGFDFYTYHPYGATENTLSGHLSFDQIMDTLNDMPLIFTEWGGYFVEDNNYVFTRFLNKLLQSGKEGRLAGFSYWVWADMYEFGRGEPACLEGKLYEGLVDIHRTVRPMYAVFSQHLNTWNAPLPRMDQVTPCDIRVPEGQYACIPLQAANREQEDARIRLLEESLPNKNFHHKKLRRLSVGPVPAIRVRTLGNLPVDIADAWPLLINEPVEIPVDIAAEELYLVWGTMPWGYPIEGTLGEELGRLTLLYQDGSEQEIPLQNGVHVSTILASLGPSRIQPRAGKAQPALHFSHDLNWEHYTALVCCVTADGQKVLRAIRLRYEKPGALLLYALTARKSK